MKEHYVKVIVTQKRVVYEVCTDKAHIYELIGAIEALKASLVERAMADQETDFELTRDEDDEE